MKEELEKRIKELDEEFELIKANVIKAEEIARKGKESMIRISGAYAELSKIIEAMDVEKDGE